MADGSLSYSFLSLADRQLLTERLTTTDPEADTSRIRLEKQNPGPPIILRYDVAPGPDEDADREYVWCGHCGRPTHWRGYVVEAEGGTLVNLGGMCGVKHFGFEFGAVENAFDERVERQAILPRVPPPWP